MIFGGNGRFQAQSRALRALILGVASVAWLGIPVVAKAESFWIGPSLGNWSASSYWNGGEPGQYTTAHVGNGKTVLVTASNELCGILYVGDRSYGSTYTGAVSQSSGSLLVNSNLYVGRQYGTSGTYTLGGGTLRVISEEYVGSLSGARGAFVQSGGTHYVGMLYVGASSGGGTFALSGTGTLIANGNEYIGTGGGEGVFTQSGGTNRISYGSLILGDSSDAIGSYSLASGTLASINELVGNVGGGSITQSGGSNVLSGSLILANGTSASGQYVMTDGSLAVQGAEYIGSYGRGEFSQTGGVHTITGSDGLVLAQEAGSSGAYSLNGGTLSLRALSAGDGTATFNFGGGTLQAAAGFTTALDMALTGENGDARVNMNSRSVEFSGDLSGPGGLVVNGNGGLTLSGDSTYLGPTTVNAGLLNVPGSITSSVSVNSGAILAGTGVVGAVSVADGGAIAPGNFECGVLTLTGDLVLSPGASLLYDLESPGHSSLLSLSDFSLTIDGLDLSNFSFDYSSLALGAYTLIDAQAIVGSLGSNRTTTLDGLTATLSYSAAQGDVLLTLRDPASVVVPEPTSLLLLSAGLLGLAFLRQRPCRQAPCAKRRRRDAGAATV